MSQVLKHCGLNVGVCKGCDVYTRSQDGKKSYLDYFLMAGVKISDVTIKGSIGKSDHRVVSCRLMESCPVRRKSRIIFSESRATGLLGEMAKSGEMDQLLALPALRFFLTISGQMVKYAITFEPKPRSYFRAIAIVDREIQSPAPDWSKVRRAILSCRGTELIELMEKLNALRCSSDMKGFFAIVGNLLRLRKQAFTAQEIQDPLNPGDVLFEPDKIRPIILEKYCALFSSGDARVPFLVNDLKPASIEEVTAAAELVSSGKGLGIDCVPDVLLKMSLPRILEKLVEFVNVVFRRKMIPAPFRFARLHLINKLKDGMIPGLDDLRPIMISSPLVKLIEALALLDLKRVLETKINLAQVGFLPGLNTQTHILRLVGRVLDVRSNPNFSSGSWFVLFIGFKAAFDLIITFCSKS